MTSVIETAGSGAGAVLRGVVAGADSSTGMAPVTDRAARAARRDVGTAGCGEAGIIGVADSGVADSV
ncbi:hypothetical protein GCM10009816_02230 [Microbacterium aquimaris]